MKIAVIGSGIYALALIHGMEKNNNSVNLWTHDGNIVKQFVLENIIENNLNNKTPQNINMVSTDIKKVCEDVDLIYIVVTSEHFHKIIDLLHENSIYKPICIATKGLDSISNDFLSNTIKKYYDENMIGILSGPCFATDLLNDELVALSVGIKNEKMFDLIEKSIASKYIFLEKINGFIAIQLCNSIKNIIAIASGMLSGYGYSNSTNAFLITKVIEETNKILYKLFDNENYILSCAGVGDMILTCTSEKSRNFKYGFDFVKNLVDKTYLATHTVEGYTTLKNINQLFINHNINSEFINCMYDIIINNQAKENIIEFLRKRN